MAKEKHPLTNWYKLFSGIFCTIYVSLVLLIVLSCPPNISPTESYAGLFRNVACVAYGLATLFILIVGLLPNILGWQHVRSRRRSAAFFQIVFLIYLLGFIIIAWLKFLK